MLSDLSPTNKERDVYETIETADHEYEILDNYNQDNINISSPDKPKPKPEVEAVQMQPLPSTGDYEFTQCPAYVPVATTSIHGNTNEPADETSSNQPSTTQDNQKDK